MSTSQKLGVRDYAGVTLLSAGPTITDSLITTFFMLYMTDYSGLGAWSAALASGVLIAARVFDFVCTPTVGILVAKSKPGRFGKYRPFLLLSLLLSTVGVFLLFHVPEGLSQSFAGAAVFVMAAYLLFDIGSSFNMVQLLYRSMTTDTAERGNLLIGPRYMNMAIGIGMSGMVTIAARFNQTVGNMHTSFGRVVSLYMFPTLLLSLLGLSLVQERHTPAVSAAAKVSLKDIVLVFKENPAYRVRTLSAIFSGFVWTLLFSTLNYYTKWTYAADLATGAVDAVLYGRLVMISSILTILPLLIGSAIASPLMKWIGSPDRFTRILLIIQAVPLGLMFVLHMTGIVQKSFLLFFLLVGVAAFSIGCNFMPESVMAMESMDYDIYKNGIDRGPIYHAVSSLIGKIQTTFSSVAIATVLTSIGYVVDSKTDTFLGDLAALPGMLTGFTVLMGLLPAILSLIALWILHWYPITNEIRKTMENM